MLGTCRIQDHEQWHDIRYSFYSVVSTKLNLKKICLIFNLIDMTTLWAKGVEREKET